MSFHVVSAMPIIFLATGLALLTSCDHLQTPRFTHPTEPEPVIPLSVKLVFDESVRLATVEQTVCADVLWKGRLGDAVIQSFSETGRIRLAHLTVGDTSGTAQPATDSASEITAFITLTSASFVPTSRSGSDDSNYLAQFDVRLTATFQDAQGHRFPRAPMVYSHRAAFWTSPIGGSDNRCGTGQLDAAVRTASDHLAGQLMGYLAQLQEKTERDGTAGRRASVTGTSPMAPKASLLDASNSVPASAPLSAIPPASTTAEDGRDPNRYAIIVALDRYRTLWPGWHDGLSFDIKETVSLLADSLNVPEGQTLLLQDELATKSDVEEALASWLPKRITKNSIVVFYFAGQALANSKSGDIFLIPYDSTPQSSQLRLVSLRSLQTRLLKLGARLVIAVVDAPIPTNTAEENSSTRPVAPNWIGNLDRSSNIETRPIIQVSRRSPLAQARLNLLSGLTGKADRDGDGTVTVGEWLRSLRSIAITVPTLPPDLATQSIPLSRVNRP